MTDDDIDTTTVSRHGIKIAVQPDKIKPPSIDKKIWVPAPSVANPSTNLPEQK